jgi:hypothetical protein
VANNNTPDNTNSTSLYAGSPGGSVCSLQSNPEVTSKAPKPHFNKYTPPRHGILRLSIMDGFTQKESYRVISPGDCSNIMHIAQQSGDVLAMAGFGIQNYKIRFTEALGKHANPH